MHESEALKELMTCWHTLWSQKSDEESTNILSDTVYEEVQNYK